LGPRGGENSRSEPASRKENEIIKEGNVASWPIALVLGRKGVCLWRKEFHPA